MIGHLLLAIFGAWVVLQVLVHLVLAAACWIYPGDVEQFEQTMLFHGLVFVGAILTWPIFFLLNTYRRALRFYVAFRLALRMLAHVDEKHKQAEIEVNELDMTVLPHEEQRAFIRRLNSDEDKGTVLNECLRRVREVQEATK